MKKLLSILLAILIVVFSVCANASETESISMSSYQIDENITRVIYGDYIIDDEWTESYRKITTYYGENVVVDYYDMLTGIMETTKNGEYIGQINVKEEREKLATEWSIPEEDLYIIEEYLNRNKEISTLDTNYEDIEAKYNFEEIDGGGFIVTPVDNNNKMRSGVSYVHASTPQSAYPIYYNHTIATKNLYSSVCNYTLSMKVRESMYDYVQLGYESILVKAGNTISTAATIIGIGIDLATNLLSAYCSIVNEVWTLTTDVNFYTDEEYRYTLKREGCIYDYTNYKRDVSVVTNQANGKIILCWDRNSKGEYVNPHWELGGNPTADIMSNSQFFTEVQEVWEFNITEYGYWKWGDI